MKRAEGEEEGWGWWGGGGELRGRERAGRAGRGARPGSKAFGHKGLGCSERRRGGYGEYEFKAARGWGIGGCAGGSCLMPI